MRKKSLYILFLIVLLVGASVERVMAQEGYKVQRVKFKGNSLADELTIRDIVNISGTNIYKRWILRKERSVYYSEIIAENELAIQRYFQKQGYLNCTIDSTVIISNKKREKVKVFFYLNIGPYYTFGESSIVVNGDQKVTDYFKGQALKTKMFELLTKKGNRFIDESVFSDEKSLAHWFSDNGYPYSEVSKDISLNTDSLTAKIDWTVQTGPKSVFGKTTIVGNEKIITRKIAKHITIKEGKTYNIIDTEDTQRRIVDLGAFNVVTITPVLSKNQSDTIPVKINVREAPRFTTRFGVGYGKEEHFRAFVKFTKIGFLGGARRAELFAKHSYLEPYNFSLRFTQPGFIYPLTSLVLNPYLAKNNEIGYELTKVGGSLTLQKSITRNLIASIGLHYEGVQLDTTSVADIPQSTDLSSDYTKSGFNFTTIYDNTLPKFDPNNGYIFSVNSKLNGLVLEQEYPFFKISAEIKKFAVIYRKWVLATKVMAGSIMLLEGGTSVPVEERFFAGGVGSIRGWGRQELGPKDENGVPIGGNSIFEGSLELRVPIVDPVRGVVFFEGGNVWEESFRLQFANLSYAAGVGIRVASPIGPIGFDVARPIFNSESSWQFMINIGPTF